MFPNKRDLLDKIFLGEDSYLELEDEQAVSTATLHDLQPPLWERFATPRTQETSESLLQKLGAELLYVAA